jgi:hypothetical protein
MLDMTDGKVDEESQLQDLITGGGDPQITMERSKTLAQ